MQIPWRAVWIGFFLAFGTLTTVFTAMEEGGSTQDEPTYRKAGLSYLQTRSFHERNGHPPFSSVLGATLPYALGSEHPVLFRLPHIALVLLAGILLCWMLWRTYGSLAALVLSLLFATCPNLKAMASLHVNDSDLAVLTALGVVWAIRGQAVVSGLSLGFAACAKVTGLFFHPIAVIMLKLGRRPLWPFVAATLLAVTLSHLVSIPTLHWLWPLIFQIRHAGEGHGCTLFGNFSHSGFLYYFFVHFLFKTSLATHVLLGVSGFWLWKNRDRYRREVIVFVALPVVFMILLSMGKVHIGYRYFLPGLLLAYLGTAIAWGKLLEGGSKEGKNKFTFTLVVLGAVLLLEDVRTLKWNSYLAYFNVLTPSPTKNFSDSSIDWGQGLPARHVHKIKNPETAFTFSFSEAFKKAFDQPFNLIWGASSLSGQFVWPAGRWLYPRTPETTLAGYEIHQLTPRKLFEYLRKQYPPAHESDRDLLIFKGPATECADRKPFLTGTGATGENLCWIPQTAVPKLGPTVARVRDPQGRATP